MARRRHRAKAIWEIPLNRIDNMYHVLHISRTLVVLASTCTFLQTSHVSADLIGISVSTPLTTYDLTGSLAYDATTQRFSVDATPILYDPPPGTPYTGTPSFSLDIVVDNAGRLVGGVPGDDLVLMGSLSGVGSGIFLTGEVTQFGFEDTGTTTDEFDFAFTVTGGLFAPDFVGTAGVIGVVTSSEESSFVGGFTDDFSGGAAGNVGPGVVIPEPQSIMAIFGLVGIVGLGRRRKRVPKDHPFAELSYIAS